VKKARLQLAIGQYSCAGEKTINQDSMAARSPGGSEATVKGAAFAVADGISSSQISQQAAETAVTALVTDYYATPQSWTVKTSAARVIQATNSWLFAQNRRRRTSDMNHGMVCTLSALIIKARQAHIFHVGDSRVSRLCRDSFEPFTQDHTTIYSEREQYLGRAIGAQHQVDIDYQLTEVTIGDVFLLTTDGLHDFITAEDATEAICGSTDLDQAARFLIDTALDRGSTDNLTVQIIRVDELPEPDLLRLPGDNDLPVAKVLKAGDLLDGYQVVREVHHSSRSQLVLATSEAKQYVAIKIPCIETTENSDALQRFLFEEWVARRVNSPHIVKAASNKIKRSANYVALQWIEGATLRQWLFDNPKPTIDEVRSIADQIVRGLRALHRQEMIHQDLRPENIMLDRNGTAIIVDLGSVAVAGLEQASPGSFGALPGTLQYTAPEYLTGGEVSFRSDQYSLAVVVYEMLTGRLPYGTKVAQVRNWQDQQRLSYQSAAKGNESIPAWVDSALSRACHRDPHRRYDALSEFLADLKAPGKNYRPNRSRPLLERNPLRFWQVVVFIQLAAIIALMVLK